MQRLLLLVLAAAAVADDAEKPAERPKKALNRYYRGKIVRIHKGRVTLYYDFEDPAQLEDFEDARPPHLLDAGQNDVEIKGGRLHLRRSSSIRHKMEGVNRAEARFIVNATRKGCVGTVWTEPILSGGYSLTTIWDCRFYGRGAFWLFAIGIRDAADSRGRLVDGLNFRDVCSIDPRVVAKQIVPGQDCEMEVARDGWHEWVRLGEIHRKGSTKSKMERMESFKFGFWVHECDASFDDLYLTVEPPQEYLDLEDLELKIAPQDAVITESAVGRLVKTIRKAPLSEAAAECARELSRRGPDGWKKLVQLIRSFARKRPYAAVPLVRALANGDEPDRRQILLGLWDAHKQIEIRMAVANGLAPSYPENRELLHEALKLAAPGRVALFRAILHRGLPDTIVRECFKDDLLAREAYEVLRAREAELGGALGNVPSVRALEGHTPSTANAFAAEFAQTRDWDLLLAFIQLLKHQREEVRDGAYLLLLTTTGVDLPPDEDLWMSWVSAKREGYVPPPPSAPGPVTAAILRARAFLRRDLLDDGASKWPTSPDWPGAKVGATALTVLALRASGLSPDDPAISKALQETLLVYPAEGAPGLRGDLDGYTYALSLLAMALQRVDRAKFKPLLKVLGRRLGEGQLSNGQWTYHCKPAKYRTRKIVGDNSNTQYAILGLRAVRRAGIEVDPEIFRRTAKFWMSNANAYGGWGYGPKGSFDHETSMTAAGISTLVICAEAVYGPKALGRVRDDKRVGLGQLRLGEILLQKGYKEEEIYTFYGIERACILTGTRAFNDFDWYHEGAKLLVARQQPSGAWGDDAVRGVTTGRGYGRACDTAFALLFLKRSTTRLLGGGEGGVVTVPKMMRPLENR